MAGEENRDPVEDSDRENMLNAYIHDYMLKRNFHDCAALFAQRTNVSQHGIDIDSPQGFLKEWWSTFWNDHFTRTGRPVSVPVDSTPYQAINPTPTNLNPGMGPQVLDNRNFHPGMEPQMMTPTTQAAEKQAVVSKRKSTRQQKQQHKGTAGSEVNVGAADAEGDEKVDDNIESLSTNTLSALEPSPLDSKKTELKDFCLKVVDNVHPSNAKLTCCHFSSDGKILATGGHEKKVVLWNLDNLELYKMEEEHSDIITDIRFRPGSTVFATSSIDRTVRLWDSTQYKKSTLKYQHCEQVMSLDFNEKYPKILCSCDSNDRIQIWNTRTKPYYSQTFKGANRQVRFRPQSGDILAAASGSTINLIDVNKWGTLMLFQGHSKDIRSLCWDIDGNYVASVSEDSARLWCVRSGKCVQELNFNENNFESCAFHPCYEKLLVIGSDQSLVLWNAKKNKTLTIEAHQGLISCVANSPQTGMIATASHDEWIRLWE